MLAASETVGDTCNILLAERVSVRYWDSVSLATFCRYWDSVSLADWSPNCWHDFFILTLLGAQWLGGRVLDSRPRGRGFEPNRRHCVVSLSKTHMFILA